MPTSYSCGFFFSGCSFIITMLVIIIMLPVLVCLCWFMLQRPNYPPCIIYGRCSYSPFRILSFKLHICRSRLCFLCSNGFGRVVFVCRVHTLPYIICTGLYGHFCIKEMLMLKLSMLRPQVMVLNNKTKCVSPMVAVLWCLCLQWHAPLLKSEGHQYSKGGGKEL